MFPAFLDPYRKGWQLALQEINRDGGVLGRKLEVVSRDDGGNPGSAVRVAEELIFGTDRVTTGAADDIRRATNLARRMVTEFGFSERLGPLRYSENEEEIFLGREVTRHKNISEDTARSIDSEVRRLIDTNYARAKKILTDHMDQLHRVAEALIEYETLEDDEIDQVMAGKKLHREVPPEKPHTPPPSASAPAATTPPVEIKGKEAGQEG